MVRLVFMVLFSMCMCVSYSVLVQLYMTANNSGGIKRFRRRRRRKRNREKRQEKEEKKKDPLDIQVGASLVVSSP